MLISAWDLVMRSVDLYKKNGKSFLTYAFVLYIPQLIALVLVYLFDMMLGENSLAFLGLTPLTFILASLVTFWFSIAFIHVIADSYEGRSSKDIKAQIMDAKHLVWPAILASIVSGLAVLGGVILLIIPGIIFSIWFAFVLYAVVLDDKRGVDSLRYSKSLVQGRWWAVLWRLLLPGLVYLVISWVINLPLGFLAETVNSEMISFIIVLLSTAVTLVLTPFITSAQTILYIELKRVPLSAKTPPPAGAMKK